ncbi:LuxR C-terminal-related transcriptional regulator [Adlercreutzia sp. ZJ141]|uniref:LuxR C-terminal-related transcriptional regulator n=1 Tax=Adlercreutzia sp. ZJ141 TaxID=2709406 RepID=UPI0013ED79B6|nr:LuxR C-terminal-related transcriptional regulator [Adlercreutzia sp. ZJ141]
MNTAESVVLISRCRVPESHATVFYRKRITNLIEDSSGNPMVIAAPAGSGKTTALIQWCKASTDRACAWLSVEPNTHDSTVFWSYVICSLGHTIPEIGAQTLLQGISNRMTRATINLLINRLAKQQRSFSLVIDNIENIKSEVIWQELDSFCSSVSPFGRIVLAGRSLPKFPLSRTSIDNRMRQIGFSALAFNRLEISQLIEASMPSGKGPATTVLHESSGGWPTIALALIRSWEEGNSNLKEALVPHSNTLALDFIQEEVFVNVPSDSLDFLKVVSALPVIAQSTFEQIVLPLCHTIGSSADLHIKRLYRDYCLLERVSGYGYRCNPVIASILQKQLQQENPELHHSLNENIANTLVQHQRPIEAIPYACKGECWDMAVGLILKTYSQIGMEGQFKKLIQWLDEIPHEYFDANPELNLAKATALIPSGPLEETEHLLAKVAQNLERQPNTHDISEDNFPFFCGPPIIRAYNAAFAMNNGSSLIAYAAETKKLLGTQSSQAYESSITLMNGIGNMLQGDLSTAEQQLSRQLEKLDDEEVALYVPLLAAFYMSLILYQRARLDDAQRLIEKSIAKAHNNRGESLEIEGMLRIMYAWVLYDTNKLEECRSQALQGTSILRDQPSSPFLSVGCEILFYVLTALNDMGGIEKYRRKYRQQSHAMPTSFMRLSMCTEIMENKSADDDSHSRVSSRGFSHLWHLRRVAQTAIEQKKWDYADSSLKSVADDARSIGLLRYTMEAQAIRSILLSKTHREIDALDALSEALRIGESCGSVRVFLDEGEAMKSLLVKARKRGLSPRFVVRLLHLFPQTIVSEECVLTSRELEILTLLSDGHSPKEIAATLYVSTGTVRTHLHHIYEKLNISGQREAILKAQQLGLL